MMGARVGSFLTLPGIELTHKCHILKTMLLNFEWRFSQNMNQVQYRTTSLPMPAAAMNKVLRNTYALLSMTLLFSAVMAGVAMAFNWPYPGPLIVLVGYFGLLFLTTKLRNSGWGIVSVFALTGFMGVTLGPIINMYLYQFGNGNEIVMMALGGTGIIFLAMSGLALTSKRDFSFMGKFLAIGILVAFVASLGNLFFQLPALGLAVSSMFILLMAGLILFQTQQIVRGGETNYIMATVTLFVSIFNLFISLLQILGFGFGED
jgi:modulator of FtsH protease